MHTIHAVWKNGQIVPMEPIEWSEGTPLAVAPIDEPIEMSRAGDLLGDDPASISRWLTWFDALDPLSFTAEEEAAWQTARRERRESQKAQFLERSERLSSRFRV